MVAKITRCQSPGSYASAWPELIIAYDVRWRGLLQTDRQKDTSQPGYVLRLWPLQAPTQKIEFKS